MELNNTKWFLVSPTYKVGNIIEYTVGSAFRDIIKVTLWH